MRKIGIIATCGPSIYKKDILIQLIINGMDIIRFNFSHADYEIFDKILKNIKEIKKEGYKIKLLADLKGNRIRVRNINNPITLINNQEITLTNKNIVSNNKLISFDYPYTLEKIKKGNKIYIDDGNIELEVIENNNSKIKTIVKRGGTLKDKKGINIPEVNLYFPLISEEDKKDIEFINNYDFDYIAQSFVRTQNDIKAVKKLLSNKNTKIIAKIENKQALKNIVQIIKISDGIMIARGDLGISVKLYKIPLLQKKLINISKKYKKFSIVATQIFESMVNNYRPTRAEVSDVANAIEDGADYIMFSAETAIGKYPIDVIRIAKDIIKYNKRYLLK